MPKAPDHPSTPLLGSEPAWCLAHLGWALLPWNTSSLNRRLTLGLSRCKLVFL
jgi:hypothetical protein